jgi:hypothetical protein
MSRCAALVLAVVSLGLVLGGGAQLAAAGARVLWPAPKHPMTRAHKAGLVPERAEQLAYHVHAHLDVFVQGARVIVPAGIGIERSDPAVHLFRAPDGSIGYGGINPPCALPCISPLHTHFDDGILHTESATRRGNKLGQFFTEWGVRLTPKCVDGYCAPKTRIAIYVNGRRRRGDPRRIVLSNVREIAIVIGKPPKHIPATFPR